MKIKSIVFIVFILFRFSAVSQEMPEVFSNIKDYHKDIRANPDHQLVEIIKVIPSISLDIRYATTN